MHYSGGSNNGGVMLGDEPALLATLSDQEPMARLRFKACLVRPGWVARVGQGSWWDEERRRWRGEEEEREEHLEEDEESKEDYYYQPYAGGLHLPGLLKQGRARAGDLLLQSPGLFLLARKLACPVCWPIVWSPNTHHLFDLDPQATRAHVVAPLFAFHRIAMIAGVPDLHWAMLSYSVGMALHVEDDEGMVRSLGRGRPKRQLPW
mmetsp:Transcript_87793/g.152740  ORF Transcript_87793/g.152740 Transcript_87793/m.152740 type:complete len:206 (-) Transcript_87793:103-720(-)